MGIGSSDKKLIEKQQGNLQTGMILVFPVEYCYLDLSQESFFCIRKLHLKYKNDDKNDLTKDLKSPQIFSSMK